MIGRVIITSVQQGLRTGAGFQPVARTKSLPLPVVDNAERETGYPHPFPPGDKRNPTVFRHRTAVLGGQTWHLLERISDAVSDYSGRSNKLSQCVAIDEAGLASLKTGPCEAVLGFPWEESWPDERGPLIEEQCPSPRPLNPPPVPCRAWQAATGDAGWAGQFALSVGKKQRAVVVAGPEHDVLALFAEALSLLPPSSRWQVTFTTCELEPSDVIWRAVRSDIKHRPPDPTELVIDLEVFKKESRIAPDSGLVRRARNEPEVKPPPEPVPETETETEEIHGEQKAGRLEGRESDVAGRIKNPATKGRSGERIERVGPSPSGNIRSPKGPNPFRKQGLSRLAISILAVLLVVVTAWAVFRETFFSSGFLRQPPIHSPSATRVAVGSLPARTKPGGGAGATEGSHETAQREGGEKRKPREGPEPHEGPEPPQRSRKMHEDQSPADRTRDKGGSSPPKSVSSEKDQEKEQARRKQEERKKAIKAIQEASPQLALPKDLKGGEQPLGIPWSPVFEQSPPFMEIKLLDGDPTKLIVKEQSEDGGGLQWKISERRKGPFGDPKDFLVATVTPKDGQLVWRWEEGAKQPAAISICCSKISFPQLDPEKQFHFIKVAQRLPEPYSIKVAIKDLPDANRSNGDPLSQEMSENLLANAFAGDGNFYPSVRELEKWGSGVDGRPRLALRLRCSAFPGDWQSEQEFFDGTNLGSVPQDVLSVRIKPGEGALDLANVPQFFVTLSLKRGDRGELVFQRRVHKEEGAAENELVSFASGYLAAGDERAEGLLEKRGKGLLETKMIALPPMPTPGNLLQRESLRNISKWGVGLSNKLSDGTLNVPTTRNFLGTFGEWCNDFNNTNWENGGGKKPGMLRPREYISKWIENGRLTECLDKLQLVKAEIEEQRKGVQAEVQKDREYLEGLRASLQDLLDADMKVEVSVGVMTSLPSPTDKFDVPLLGLE